MDPNHIATKEDIELLKVYLDGCLIKIQHLMKLKNEQHSEFLRTNQVKQLLNVSTNKLKTMRDKGEIPYSFIGSTYFYPREQILEILRKNLITNK